MYDLIQLAPSTYYIKTGVNIGLIKLNDTDVCIIDSGLDKEVGRKVRQILDNNNWNLVAIYNTHSHADHIGGNKYLQDNKKCKIYAPEVEDFFVNNPVFEPVLLNSALPYKEQMGKFLMAQKSNCLPLTDDVLPQGVQKIKLSGHCYNMVGFKTDDDVVFLADSLCSELTLKKYQISYIFNVGEYLQTLEELKNIKAKYFVASHVRVCENIDDLIELNINKVMEIGEVIVQLCGEGVRFEELLESVFEHYGLAMNQVQYILISSTIRSYLTWLKELGRVEIEFSEKSMLWKKI